MSTKINLTRLLNKQKFKYDPAFPTDAAYLPISKDRTSQEEAYAFELEQIGANKKEVK